MFKLGNLRCDERLVESVNGDVMDIKLSDLPVKEYIPGYHGRMIHTDRMTMAYWEVEQDAVVPEHEHDNEQIMQVLEGRFELTLDGISQVYEPGDLVVIPSMVRHGGRAITSCRILDVFSPVREAYR